MMKITSPKNFKRSLQQRNTEAKVLKHRVGSNLRIQDKKSHKTINPSEFRQSAEENLKEISLNEDLNTVESPSSPVIYLRHQKQHDSSKKLIICNQHSESIQCEKYAAIDSWNISEELSLKSKTGDTKLPSRSRYSLLGKNKRTMSTCVESRNKFSSISRGIQNRDSPEVHFEDRKTSETEHNLSHNFKARRNTKRAQSCVDTYHKEDQKSNENFFTINFKEGSLSNINVSLTDSRQRPSSCVPSSSIEGGKLNRNRPKSHKASTEVKEKMEREKQQKMKTLRTYLSHQKQQIQRQKNLIREDSSYLGVTVVQYPTSHLQHWNCNTKRKLGELQKQKSRSTNTGNTIKFRKQQEANCANKKVDRFFKGTTAKRNTFQKYQRFLQFQQQSSGCSAD